MTNPSSDSPEELAARICGPARYKFDVLVEGVRLEQERLSAGAHLVVLWHQDLDYDGLTDWLFLGNAFDTVDAARRSAQKQLADLSLAYTNLSPPHRPPWIVDPTRHGPFIPKVPLNPVIQVEDEQTLTLGADGFNRQTFRTRVLGPVSHPIVGPALFDLLAESRQELWAFFLAVGAANAAGKSRPMPGPPRGA